MTPKKIPYLCGGILFSLILQARKTRTKARDKFNSGSDGLNDTDVMMGLVEVVTGDSFTTIQGKTFGKCTTQFKTCQDYGATYIPFTDITVIRSFNSSLKQKDPNLQKRMSGFINKYINEMRSEWLVKALFELIKNDKEIPLDTPFSISDGQIATKKEIDSISEVELSIFLLSVISFILNERKDNTKGRPTFESWHTQSGPKSPWKYTADIGNSINKIITVTTKHEIIEEEFIDTIASEHSLAESPIKTATERMNEKILASGQSLADAWGDAMKNFADEQDAKNSIETKYIELPEEQPSDEYPYSSEDKLLLQEFTADYDEIMFTMIGENYGVSLVDMSLPNKVQALYKTKWNAKADAFSDPTLKSYVLGLLGELNQLSSSLVLCSGEPFSIKSTRTKIRNLYVKLHPDSFAKAFPYDAFIDDWDDGEF